MVANVDRDLKVKVLVLGDSGVGKSSLTHLIAYGQTTKTPGYTIGCSTEIKLHDYKQGTLEEKTFCVEVWDIGASKSHASSRSIFYNNVNGVILVHDLTNNKSLLNLNKWLDDVLNHESQFGLNSVKVSTPTSVSQQQQTSNDRESSFNSFPIIMVGTKLGLVNEANRASKMIAGKSLSTALGCTEISLDTSDPKYLVAGSGNSVKLSRFFDKAIEQALVQQRTSIPMAATKLSPLGGGMERKRIPSSNKMGAGLKSD